jgi:hypothetical protein
MSLHSSQRHQRQFERKEKRRMGAGEEGVVGFGMGMTTRKRNCLELQRSILIAEEHSLHRNLCGIFSALFPKSGDISARAQNKERVAFEWSGR